MRWQGTVAQVTSWCAAAALPATCACSVIGALTLSVQASLQPAGWRLFAHLHHEVESISSDRQECKHFLRAGLLLKDTKCQRHLCLLHLIVQPAKPTHTIIQLAVATTSTSKHWWMFSSYKMLCT